MSNEPKRQKRVAIMGGTFDPIHNGHLVAAEAVRHEFSIDEVVFVPTGNPPHKADQSVTQAEHRYLMTALATATNPHFSVSRIEIDREGPTYTVDTIKALNESYGEAAKLYFITGADTVHKILTWKNSEELLKICTFVAVTRPGYEQKDLLGRIEELRENYESSICFLEVPALAISSSDIRNRVAHHKPIKYLVTSAVENYIMKYHFYEAQSKDPIRESLFEYAKTHLTPHRYKHTEGVIKRALELGKIYRISEEKLILSALIHDFAKSLSPEKLIEACEEAGVVIDAFEARRGDLLHGKLAAYWAKSKWGIEDQDILNSISYHTFGRKAMSDLEKIIFLADMTEENRKPFEGIEKIRKLSENNLDMAMYEALLASKKYVTEVLKQEVHPGTEQLIAYYNEKAGKFI